MNLNDITAKKPQDLSTEEKDFLAQHKNELTDEQKATFEQALEAGTTPAPEPTPEPEPAPAPEPREASEPKGKMIQMSEAEVNTLRAKADAGQKAFEKLEMSERKALVSKLTFSEGNKDGRFLPKQAGALEGFLRTLSETQRDQFINIVSNMPKSSIFGEIGDGGSTDTTTAKEVETKVQDAIKASDGKLSYSDAVRKVFKEHPALAKSYEEEQAAQD